MAMPNHGQVGIVPDHFQSQDNANNDGDPSAAAKSPRSREPEWAGAQKVRLTHSIESF